MASPTRKFRYPIGVIPGNVEHFEGNSEGLHKNGTGIHHVFEVSIPIIMGLFVILFFLFTTLYLAFSLIRLYYSDKLKPYKTKTLKSLGKHRHHYVGGESVSYITEGTRKSSLSLSKFSSKKSRRFGDSGKQATPASSAAPRRSEITTLKPGEPTPDFILLPRDLPVLSRFPSGKGMQKFYIGSSEDTQKTISGSGIPTNRKGHPWEWDQEWYPKTSVNRAEHRKSLDMLRTTHSELQKTVSSFPKGLAKSDVSMPELTADQVRQKRAEAEKLLVPIAVVTEATPVISEQNVALPPPPMSTSEPIRPPVQRQIPAPSNAKGGRGQKLQPSYSAGRKPAATSKPVAPVRKMQTREPAPEMPTKAPDDVKPAEPVQPSEPLPAKAMPEAEIAIYVNPLVSSTDEMSTTDSEMMGFSQVITQPSQMAGRGQVYPRRQAQGRRPQQQGRNGRGKLEIITPRPFSPWSPSARGRGWTPRQIGAFPSKNQKKRRSKSKQKWTMPLPPTTEPDEIQEVEVTTEENTRPLQDGNEAELGEGTEEAPPTLTPLKFTKQANRRQRPKPPPSIHIWEREPRPVTPSRAEIYSRYTFRLDNDAISSRAHTNIPKAKKPWDKGFTIVRGGPRRKSTTRDIEQVKENGKSNEDGGDVPPPLNKDKND